MELSLKPSKIWRLALDLFWSEPYLLSTSVYQRNQCTFKHTCTTFLLFASLNPKSFLSWIWEQGVFTLLTKKGHRGHVPIHRLKPWGAAVCEETLTLIHTFTPGNCPMLSQYYTVVLPQMENLSAHLTSCTRVWHTTLPVWDFRYIIRVFVKTLIVTGVTGYWSNLRLQYKIY